MIISKKPCRGTCRAAGNFLSSCYIFLVVLKQLPSELVQSFMEGTQPTAKVHAPKKVAIQQIECKEALSIFGSPPLLSKTIILW